MRDEDVLRTMILYGVKAWALTACALLEAALYREADPYDDDVIDLLLRNAC